MAGLTGKIGSHVDCHIDVTEDDGLIIIPYKEIPGDWEGAPDIRSYCSLDRSFVFPGEQIQLLVCLSATKHNTGITGITTPSNNGIEQRSQRQDEKVVGRTIPFSLEKDAYIGEQNNKNVDADSQNNVATDESILRMEDHRRQTDQLLQRFRNSHFFARIAESNEPLWSERSSNEARLRLSETSEEKLTGGSSKTVTALKKENPMSVVMIDRGEFDSPATGGIARGAAKCCALLNGDIVVILQVKVGVELMKEPILEILQFEKYHKRNSTHENQHILTSFQHDPCGELLDWLLPLTNSRRLSSHPSSPILHSSSITQSLSTKPPVSSGPELVSFGHIRSYSMSSLQPARPAQATAAPNAKPHYVAEDQNQYSFENYKEIEKSNNEGLLSFRGVSLLPERFSVQCGLEGVFTPGRRWKRRLELIQPLQIHTFSVDCNTDDLLCVLVKNVSPENAPDVVVFIDSVTIAFEETSKSGAPLSLPIACTEAGINHSLPNLALRRGEEHSFILKPATTLWKHSHGQICNLPSQNSSTRTASSSLNPLDVQYVVLVSCRCNYTESKLFFKHRTSWQPRIARGLMISVASEMSRQTLASDGSLLPVQVLSLRASNMTPDDLTLTVLAINDDQPVQLSDAVLKSDWSSTHLWLQSRAPLGCIRSQSMAAMKLELLPLKDGILTLDSLQIYVKEKGLTFRPKHALKINEVRAPLCDN